jgi:hypothetical protein
MEGLFSSEILWTQGRAVHSVNFCIALDPSHVTVALYFPEIVHGLGRVTNDEIPMCCVIRHPSNRQSTLINAASQRDHEVERV